MFGSFSGWLNRAGVIVIGVLVLSLGVVGTAFAINAASFWNTQSNPLYAGGYGSKAWAYGSIKLSTGSDGTRLRSTAYNKFIDADNHRAYLDVTTQFNAGTCREYSPVVIYKGVSVAGSASCTKQFYDYGGFEQGGLNYTHTKSWIPMAGASGGVHSKADRGRVEVYLCLDIPWRWDLCSGPSYSTSDSY